MKIFLGVLKKSLFYILKLIFFSFIGLVMSLMLSFFLFKDKLSIAGSNSSDILKKLPEIFNFNEKNQMVLNDLLKEIDGDGDNKTEFFKKRSPASMGLQPKPDSFELWAENQKLKLEIILLKAELKRRNLRRDD